MARKLKQDLERTPAIPGFLEPQHPKLVDRPPRGDDWLHEIKYDGYRLQARVDRGAVTLFTRNGHDWTDRFPTLARAAGRLPDGIYDGELCAVGEDGQPVFADLQAAIAARKTDDLVLFLFDRLFNGPDDIRAYALTTRKASLRKALDAAGDVPQLRWTDEFAGDPRGLWQAACAMRLEGIVSKRRGENYRSGKRDGTWVKVKCRPSQELVIGGWKEAEGRFKALIAGVYDDVGRLVYVGRIETGFSTKAVLELVKRLRLSESDASPFDVGKPSSLKGIRWARPELVAAVEIAEWTPAGRVRQAAFKGLREDKDPNEVRREG